MQQFDQLVSINFQGTVVVFGRPTQGERKSIYFNILGQDTDVDDPQLVWTGFTKLDFPKQVRQAGMSLITVAADGTTMRPSDGPFRVVTDQQYISVIQQSEHGTLYVNRFRLLKSQTGGDQKQTVYSLDPAWEVRFARSGKEDVPADKADNPGFLDAHGDPFLEPALELSMVDGVSDGTFEVMLLPVTGQDTMAWQFITPAADGTSINMFNFPPTDTGLLDYTGNTITDAYEIEPDSVFHLRTKEAATALPLQSSPRAALYTKHENVVQPDGTTIGVQRAVRTMLAIPVKDGTEVKTATIDSAVSAAGTLAELSGAITADAIEPADFDLLFTTSSYLQLDSGGISPDPLAIKGPYLLSFMASVKQLADGRQIIGGDPKADAKTAAPYARIVDGGKLELGFGTGTEAVSCRTMAQVFYPGGWSSLSVEYTGAGEDPFVVKLNDNIQPLTSCTAPAEPSGTPISLIGAPEDGYEGALNRIGLSVDSTAVLDLPCDQVDYTAQPPTTPNDADSGVTAQVYGAKTEPSSSPVNANTNGAFYVDADGLSYYVGLADFIVPQSGTCLIDGSDGLLHLYYSGTDQDLSVAQFSKNSARATFKTDWATDWSSGVKAEAAVHALDAGNVSIFYAHPVDDWVHSSATVMTAPTKEQSGVLNFVAHRVGTSLNGTKITVRPSSVSGLLCDVTVDAPLGIGTETWTGLPRDIDQFVKVWNGASAGSPDDQGVLDQSKPFFDYQSKLALVLAPTKAEESYFLFASVPGLGLALDTVAIAQSEKPDEVDLSFASAKPPNWDDGAITQDWTAVPGSARGITDVLTGRAEAYDYDGVTTTGTRAYGSPVTLNRSDEAQAHVVVFVRDALKDFALTVEQGSSSAKCKVTIAGKTLADVPRDQISFAKIINGLDDKYSYPDGYRDEIAKNVFAITNGLSGTAMNTAQAEPANALVYAGLLRVIYQGQSYDSAEIASISETTAAAFQSATLETPSNDGVSIRGSRLFGSLIADPPTNGGVGRLSDTTSYADGQAPISVLGVNGGWLRVAAKFSLKTNVANAGTVAFDVDKSFMPAELLVLSDDLTIECWLKPDAASKGALTRAVTYNVTGTLSDPDLPIQYMLGSLQGPALITGQSTYFSKSFNFRPPQMSVQAYVKLANGNASGTILSVFAVVGGAEYLTLSVNQMGMAEANLNTGAAVVTSTKPLSDTSWTCLTVTVSDIGDGKVALKLYFNDADPVSAEAPNAFTEDLGTLMVGSDLNTTVEAKLNGIAFWQRALSDQEAASSYFYGFPDNDTELGIRWNLAECTGTKVMNSADTGESFDATIINPASPCWDAEGAFDVPYAGRNDLVLVSNRIIKDWTHVALSSQQGWAVNLRNEAHGSVKDGDAFKPGSDLALEAWIVPTQANAKQVIFEKPGSYTLSLDTLGQITLEVMLQQDSDSYQEPPTSLTHTISGAVEFGKTNYVAVNFTTGAIDDDKGSKEFVKTKYFIRASLYINCAHITNKNVEDLSKPATVVSKTSSFYMGMSESETFFYTGLISHARVWSRTLNAAEISHVFQFHGYPPDLDGLVAGWDFAEQTGATAKDQTQNNDITLTSNQLWSVWQDVAQAKIIVDGGTSLPQRRTAVDMSGYGDTQFTFGGSLEGRSIAQPFKGKLDDIRLFDVRLTQQQIAEGMHTPYVGNEDNLVGYWKIEAGSGSVIYDATGHGNNGTVTPTTSTPGWTSDAAPIQNEADTVVNALGGTPAFTVAQIGMEPAVIEYASTQKDAYDNIYGVMMRGYFYVTNASNTILQTGYKVGDLDTIYVGQVQTQPSIIGFIEGGPPLPSENQTIAYWSGDMGGPAVRYANISTVSYVESDSKTWSFKASSSGKFISDFNLKGGFYQKSKTETSVGLGAEAETMILENIFKLGAKFSLSGGIGTSDDVAQTHTYTQNLTSSLAPAGDWEPADNILNPTVGRRYIQNNVGVAIVKSAVADLYMQALKGTQTPVGYTLVPNDTIPVDTNIIDFPINPKYVKNGTLDGKVGLVNDPDFPGANEDRGSYFKPVEAYNLKRKIEKQEEQLKAYHDQLSTARYSLLGSLGAFKDRLKENPAYDFDAKVNQRSLVNTYVWTAAGGLRREEQSVANSYSETHTGASDLKFALGAELKLDIGTPFGGYYMETDAMFGGSFTMSASKTQSASNGFSLSCNVTPTDFLRPPKMKTNNDGELEFLGYGDSPAPGKVDGYRYMSFLLAPAEENFSTLTNVIDQNWLQNSTTAAASAMREAMNDPTQPWRILYRTTYVSRVPAPFQPVRDDTTVPTLTPPANLPSNYWLVGIMGKLLTGPSPTPVEIGAAIDQVLGSGATPGLLKDIIPWWSDFFAAAQAYGSTEFVELSDLRIDLLNYMLSKYEAEAYALG